MKPGIPWSVKGIGNEAREAAKFAARKSGMTLGEWLNEMILDQADENVNFAGSETGEPPHAGESGSLSLEDLAEQLQRLNAREHEAARFPEPQPVPEQLKQSSDALARVLQRIETGERQTVEALSAVNERISALGAQLNQSAKYRPPERPEDVPGYQALEGALRNIVDHIQSSEKRSRENFSLLQARMGEIAERAAGAGGEHVKANAAALSGLEGRLAELAQRLERGDALTAALQTSIPLQIDTQLGAIGERIEGVREVAERAAEKANAISALDLPRLLETQFGRVAQRIEEVRELSSEASARAQRAESSAALAAQQDVSKLFDSQIGKFDQRFDQRLVEIRQASEQSAQRAQSAAIHTAQQELRGFEGRVQTVMKEAESIIRQSAVNASTEVGKLKTSLDGVAKRVEDVSSHAVTDRDLGTLRQAIEQLSVRVAAAPDMRPLADLDRRVSDLTARIERIQQNNNSLAPQLLDIDRRVQQIDGGLRDVMASGPDHTRNTQVLEQYIAQLNERLNRTEQHLGHFNVIEQSLQQLFAAIEQAKGMAQAAADDSAGRMGEQIMQSVQHSVQQSMHEAMQQTLQNVQQQQDQQQQQLRMQLEQQYQIQQQVLQQQFEQQRQVQHQAVQQQLADFAPPVHAQGPAEPSAELLALQDGLAAVRAAAAQSDKRTQETLEAVHETLEQIVTKLAEMEEGERTPPLAPYQQPQAFTQPQFAGTAQAAPAMPEPQGAQASENPFASFFDQQPGAAPEPQQLQEIFAEPPPPQPQMAPPPPEQVWMEQAAPVNPFAEAQAMPQQTPQWQVPQQQPQAWQMPQQGYAPQPQQGYADPALATSFPPLPMMPQAEPPADEFINAARRAAQSAAVVQAAQAEMHEQKGVLAKAKGFLAKKKDANGRAARSYAGNERRSTQVQPVSVGGVSIQDGSAARRKKLIMSGFVLLAALSAYGATQFFGSGSSPVAPEKQPVAGASGADPAAEPPKKVEEAAPQPAVEDAAPDSGGAQPPKPKPAELEGNLQPQPAASAKGGLETVSRSFDTLLTGALPAAKSDATLKSIVAEPQAVPITGEMPPPEVGSESLRKAAGAGDPAAQFVVASRYLDGKQVEQDFTQAAKWYQMAAQQGLAPAQYRLATLFERGRGVPQDIATAGVWYERAAERGNVKAMHNAAVIFSGNQAGKPDYEKAAIWFRAAAEHGLKDSQFNYAVLLERGLGVKQNMGEALVWYGLAAEQDDKDAAKKLQLLEQSLAPSTVEEARKRVKEWRAKPAVQEANMVPVSETAWNAVAGEAAPAAAVVQPVEPLTLVAEAQTELRRLGYNVPADGAETAKTANAIRLFQLKHGFKVTGEVTASLVKELKKAKE